DHAAVHCHFKPGEIFNSTIPFPDDMGVLCDQTREHTSQLFYFTDAAPDHYDGITGLGFGDDHQCHDYQVQGPDPFVDFWNTIADVCNTRYVSFIQSSG